MTNYKNPPGIAVWMRAAQTGHPHFMLQNHFEIAPPFNLKLASSSVKGLHSKFVSPSRKPRPQHLPTSPLHLCFVNYYPMFSVCFGRKKPLSCFLVWTSAPFPGLNVGRCSFYCCRCTDAPHICHTWSFCPAGRSLFLCLCQWPVSEQDTYHIGTETLVRHPQTMETHHSRNYIHVYAKLLGSVYQLLQQLLLS